MNESLRSVYTVALPLSESETGDLATARPRARDDFARGTRHDVSSPMGSMVCTVTHPPPEVVSLTHSLTNPGRL